MVHGSFADGSGGNSSLITYVPSNHTLAPVYANNSIVLVQKGVMLVDESIDSELHAKTMGSTEVICTEVEEV